jgi:hypothetical protein
MFMAAPVPSRKTKRPGFRRNKTDTCFRASINLAVAIIASR